LVRVVIDMDVMVSALISKRKPLRLVTGLITRHQVVTLGIAISSAIVMTGLFVRRERKRTA
jgi:predicted nucleic acid-binding protein